LAAEQDAVESPQDLREDGCVAELEIADEDITRDEDLPAASGGVDQARGAE
jgi:hypothetical protein